MTFQFFFIFKINEDFCNWFRTVKADELYVKWYQIQNGLFRFAKFSKNEHVKFLLNFFDDKLTDNGKY